MTDPVKTDGKPAADTVTIPLDFIVDAGTSMSEMAGFLKQAIAFPDLLIELGSHDLAESVRLKDASITEADITVPADAAYVGALLVLRSVPTLFLDIQADPTYPSDTAPGPTLKAVVRLSVPEKVKPHQQENLDRLIEAADRDPTGAVIVTGDRSVDRTAALAAMYGKPGDGTLKSDEVDSRLAALKAAGDEASKQAEDLSAAYAKFDELRRQVEQVGHEMIELRLSLGEVRGDAWVQTAVNTVRVPMTAADVMAAKQRELDMATNLMERAMEQVMRLQSSLVKRTAIPLVPVDVAKAVERIAEAGGTTADPTGETTSGPVDLDLPDQEMRERFGSLPSDARLDRGSPLRPHIPAGPAPRMEDGVLGRISRTIGLAGRNG